MDTWLHLAVIVQFYKITYILIWHGLVRFIHKHLESSRSKIGGISKLNLSSFLTFKVWSTTEWALVSRQPFYVKSWTKSLHWSVIWKIWWKFAISSSFRSKRPLLRTSNLIHTERRTVIQYSEQSHKGTCKMLITQASWFEWETFGISYHFEGKRNRMKEPINIGRTDEVIAIRKYPDASSIHLSRPTGFLWQDSALHKIQRNPAKLIQFRIRPK